MGQLATGPRRALHSLFPTSLLPDWRSRALAIAVTVLAGVCAFYHWRAPDPVQHAKLDSYVDRIRELEREVVGDVAFMRVGDRRSTRIREHVEALSKGVLDFKRILQDEYPGVVLRFADSFTSLYGEVEAQQRAVDSLMLHLEFMQESLNRLPETVSALERAAPGIWNDPELTATLSSIQRDLFVSASRNAASAEHWFQEDIERLRTLRDLASPEIAPVIDRIVSYCQSITEHARLVDTGLRELESRPVSQTVVELREACLVDFVARHRVALGWRWGLVLALGIVIAALSLRILVLAKSTQLDQSAAELLSTQLSEKDEQVEELGLRVEDERIRAERAEASFRRARTQEQAALHMKAEFLVLLEQRVRGRVRTLLAALADPEASEERRLEASAEARAVSDTLSDMFDMEEVRAGTLQLSPSDCRVEDLLDSVEFHGRSLSRNKAIALTVECAENAPEVIHTDSDRLRRLLQNLLEHAVFSTDTGEVALTVEPAVGNLHRLQFVLRDTGRGMNSERVDFLFTPPQDGERIENRAEAMATPGLAIVPSLVKKLGGSFQVDSVVGRGTVVTFDVDVSPPVGPQAGSRLDLARARSLMIGEPAQSVSTIQHKPDPKRPLQGRRILVAEDGEDNRRLMFHLLTRAGAEVEMAENGEAAYEAAMAAGESGAAYDVVLMDMNMPVMDGYEATEKLRTEGYEAPIVALTASALPENRDRCMEVGCDEFLTKPVDAKVFAHVLEGIAVERVGAARGRGSSVADARGMEARNAGTNETGPGATAKPDPAPLYSEYSSDEDMAELIELFVKDLDSDMRRINAALSEGDLESLGTLAHQLKGSAGSYGFPQLTKQADRLEACVRTGVDPDQLEEEVRAFVDLCRRVSA